ncbi:MAG TPA: cytochrome P450 [Nannocystis sp.]
MPSHAPSLPPGPPASRLVQTYRFARHPQSSLDVSFKRYGDAFTARLFGLGTVVVFSDPAAIEDLFTKPAEELATGECNRRLFEAFLGPHSLLNIDGPRHRRKRRLLMPPFHGQRMSLYGRTMAEITAQEMATWRVGAPFPVQEATQNITLEVILRVIFGVDDPTRRDRLRAAILGFVADSYRPTSAILAFPGAQVDLGPHSPWGRFVRVRDHVYAEILAAVADRRATGTGGRDDILSLLLDARDEDGQPMSDEELRDDLFTLLVVGHETTAATLAWGMCGVLADPEVTARLREERRQILGDGPLDTARLSELVYLDATVKEITRRYPVTDGAARLLKVPTQLGRHHLPAGIVATASTWLTHTNPALWRDPLRFAPERFLEARPVPFSLLPFGGGVRTCIGMAFASYEMKIVLSEFLARADLELAPGYTPRVVRRTVTLSPSKGAPVRLRRPVTRA